MIGQLVGHYRVLEKIGAGGMGEVFRARDERLGRDVALKLIRPASSNNPDHLRRFEQEARAAAALNHPNILAIFDVGFEGTAPYIVSELLEGKTLRQRLSDGPIPVREAVEYAFQIAQGLVAAHNLHIVHRDLKPENVFLVDDGRVKILDFGVAKLQLSDEDQRPIQNLTTVTKHGAVIGTVAYMSPEQLRGRAVDSRSDIFSFGTVFYEMLTASRAFLGETEVDTITAVLLEEPAAANLDQAAIPVGYQDIIKHCVEKDPDSRFQSAKDLAFALQTVSGSSTVRPVVMPAPVKKARWFPWAIVALLAIVTGALAMLLMRSPLPPPSYQRLTYEAGTIYSARFAPGGKSVVFTAAWNNKPSKLFMMLGDSLLPQPLELNNATLLAISGKSELAVALGGTHNGQLETVNGMLADAPMAGGSPHELLSDVRWADWDGKGRMAVVHDADGQSRLEYPIGNVLYQTGGWISDIRFSPQFDKIAFMDHPTAWDNKGNLSFVDLNKRVHVLSQEWESERGLAWRPDGKEIWFSAVEKGNNLNLIAADLSGNVRPLIVLPDGITLQDIASDERVLFTKDAKRLAMAFGGLGNGEDSEQSWHDWNVAKDISPDGSFVLFEDSSEAAGKNYAVAFRKTDGSTQPVRMAEGSAGGLSPDGKWAISLSADSPAQLTLLPTGPGQPRSIPTAGLDHINSAWARFLENGKTVMVNANARGRASRCYALDLAGANPNPVTPEGIRCGPSSPDSRSLIGTDANHRAAIYSLDGSAPRSISGLDADFEPVQWSKDGSSLYGYRRGEIPSKIYRIEIATGKQTVVKELHPGAPAGVVAVAPVVVSRDGTRFAYSYNQTLSTLYVVSGVH